MPRPTSTGLTDHELGIMHILWDESPLSVREILERLPKDPKPAYTSLLTAVRALEKKDFLGHKKEGKAFLYFPVLPKDAYKRSALKKLLNSVFLGDSYDLAVNLVSEEKLDEQEIQKIKDLLEDL